MNIVEYGFLKLVYLPGKQLNFVVKWLAPLVAEYDQNGNLVAKYHHDGGGLIAMTRNNSSYWYGFEAIGTVRQMMDAQGQVSDAYAFDAWGNELTSPQSQVPNPFKYVGKYGYYLDAQSSLMLLGVRYYTPQVGRFVSRDPLSRSFVFLVIDYHFPSQNPVKLIDPTGLYETSSGFNCTTPLLQFPLPPFVIAGIFHCSVGISFCGSVYAPDPQCCPSAPSRVCLIGTIGIHCGIDPLERFNLEKLLELIEYLDTVDDFKKLFDKWGRIGIPPNPLVIRTCNPPPQGFQGSISGYCCLLVVSFPIPLRSGKPVWGLCRPIGCGISLSGQLCF